MQVKQDIGGASYNQLKDAAGCIEIALQLLAELPERRNTKEGYNCVNDWVSMGLSVDGNANRKVAGNEELTAVDVGSY